MKNYIVKIPVMIAGLAVISLAFFPGALNAVNAATKASAAKTSTTKTSAANPSNDSNKGANTAATNNTFRDWVKSCAKDNNGAEVCYLSQKVMAQKDQKGKKADDKKAATQVDTIAVYQIGYIGAEKKLRMVQILPLGVNLPSGTSIVSNKKLMAPGKYSVCINTGCQAIAEISETEIAEILAASDNRVAFMNAEGKQIDLPISVNGLKEGLEAIK